MFVLDVDYFKNVNDTYGHIFGDEVLKRFAELFVALFDINDVIMRLGGDEFVILLKDISHAAIMKKAGKLIREVQKLKFSGTTYLATCSVGICFLPENVSGYTYQQLFENADWALYQAKKNGKNRYAFCDNLRRFEDKTEEKQELSVNGVFIAVGILPNTEMYRGVVDLDEAGYVIAGEDGVTSCAGIFAAGDLRTKQLRQVITAAADGANVVTSIEKYLNEL